MALLIGVLLIYYIYNPVDCKWMPRCPSKLISGYDCPGCGLQRAIHAALHGHIHRAWALNPFLFFGLPYLLMVAWGTIKKLPYSGVMHRLSHNPVLIYTYIIIYFAWWIIRNL